MHSMDFDNHIVTMWIKDGRGMQIILPDDYELLVGDVIESQYNDFYIVDEVRVMHTRNIYIYVTPIKPKRITT